MRLEPFLRAHAQMRVERPPELWEAETEDEQLVPLIGEILAAGLSRGISLGELTLNVSNVVVEESDDGEPMVPPPAEYVAITISGPADFGPDDTWHPTESQHRGLLGRLHDRLQMVRARFAYVRRMTPNGSVTVFFARVLG